MCRDCSQLCLPPTGSDKPVPVCMNCVSKAAQQSPHPPPRHVAASLAASGMRLPRALHQSRGAPADGFQQSRGDRAGSRRSSPRGSPVPSEAGSATRPHSGSGAHMPANPAVEMLVGLSDSDGDGYDRGSRVSRHTGGSSRVGRSRSSFATSRGGGSTSSSSGDDSDSSSSASTGSAASWQSEEGRPRVLGDPDQTLVTGNLIVLHSDSQDLVVGTPSVTSPVCSLTERQITRSHSTVFQVLASVEAPPEPLYRPSVTGSQHVSGHPTWHRPRVDIALQKMTLWPRLLALQLEQRDIK